MIGGRNNVSIKFKRFCKKDIISDNINEKNSESLVPQAG